MGFGPRGEGLRIVADGQLWVAAAEVVTVPRVILSEALLRGVACRCAALCVGCRCAPLRVVVFRCPSLRGVARRCASLCFVVCRCAVLANWRLCFAVCCFSSVKWRRCFHLHSTFVLWRIGYVPLASAPQINITLVHHHHLQQRMPKAQGLVRAYPLLTTRACASVRDIFALPNPSHFLSPSHSE